jgi:glycosyltransferase involved in cell wall biosynthesis
VLITGVGGSIFYPFLKWGKVKFITNVDGLEAKRSKWSALKQIYISIAEWAAMRFSDHIIADSAGISSYIMQHYSMPSKYITQIEYGAALNTQLNPQVLEHYKVQHNSYFLVVSRLEPENNVHLIIDGYLKSNTALPLLIVGNVTNTSYVQQLSKIQRPNIHFIGGVYDRAALDALRYSCKAYLHGHSVGGTNPSLLEAMGSGNVCICHDNEFNREVTAGQHFYFSDSDDVAQVIRDIEQLDDAALLSIKTQAQQRIVNYYNWERISNMYKALLLRLTSNKR